MELAEVTELVGEVFEGAGVAVIAVGAVYALVTALRASAAGRSFVDEARVAFGRPLLLGLEVLIAADIIETVTVDRTLSSVLSLGLLVIVRVLLSFSLEIELDGVLPWRRARLERDAPTPSDD